MIKTFSKLNLHTNKLNLFKFSLNNLVQSNKPFSILIKYQKYSFARKVKTESEEDIQAIKNNMDFAGEKKVDKKFQAVKDFNIEESEKKESIQDSKPKSEERITTKLLSDIIGSKHYPTNEEITLNKDIIVSVYDENDKFMTNMSLEDARELARSSNKDIVLRNSKSSPVIVKLMKYKAELIKRLLKKVGKNIGRELSGSKESLKSKLFSFSLKMDKKDFDSKVDKLRQLLLENNIVKLVIPCDLKRIDETTKAISILKNIADEVTEMGKIKAGPLKQQKKREKSDLRDPTLNDSTDEILHHDSVIKDAIDASTGIYLENEKDLELVDYIYLELESLVIDTSGVDYEKLLDSNNIENIVRGITQTNLARDSTESKNFEESISRGMDNLNVIDNASIPLKNHIDFLEKEVLHQKDLRQKLLTIKSIDDMKYSLEATRSRMTVRIVKNTLSGYAKQDARKNGLLDKKM